VRSVGRSGAGAAVVAIALLGTLGPRAVAVDAPAPDAAITTTTSSPPPPTLPTGGSSTTTSSTDPGSTTTDPAGDPSTTTSAPDQSGGSTSTTSGSTGSGPTSSTTVSSNSSTTVPPPDPRLQATAASIPRSGPGTTWPLLMALAPLTHFGLTQTQTALVGFGDFPVGGPAYYTDDWLEYRSTPTPHLHEGIDIVAAPGTPLRSPTDGVLTYSNSDPDGYGITAIVTQPDKTTFVMAHMSATVLGLANGTHVTSGQVVGFVGATGDATGPHCHFEVHPYGGAGVDGKPFLDHWLAQALAGAPALVSAFQAASARGAQPHVAPVPVSIPIRPPAVRLLGAPHAPSRAATLRAPAWNAAAVVRGVGLSAAVVGGAFGGAVVRRRRRSSASRDDPDPETDPGSED
jgi:murein DD-endopeptidase MepM/ murein hydrolase activator NlpD